MPISATLINVTPNLPSQSGTGLYTRLIFRELDSPKTWKTTIYQSAMNYNTWLPILTAGVGSQVENLRPWKPEDPACDIIDADSNVRLIKSAPSQVKPKPQLPTEQIIPDDIKQGDSVRLLYSKGQVLWVNNDSARVRWESGAEAVYKLFELVKE